MNAKNIMVAALVSAITLSSCQNNGENEKSANTPMALTDGGGEGGDNTMIAGDTLLTSIPVDSANKMITSYLTSIGGVNSTQQNLYSLIVDAGSLRTYLSNPNIKNVKLMFAHTLEYINAGNAGQNCGYGSGKLTLIIAGYDGSGNYVLDTKNGVEDNLQPCPHNCPTSGTAASNTISTQ